MSACFILALSLLTPLALASAPRSTPVRPDPPAAASPEQPIFMAPPSDPNNQNKNFTGGGGGVAPVATGVPAAPILIQPEGPLPGPVEPIYHFKDAATPETPPESNALLIAGASTPRRSFIPVGPTLISSDGKTSDLSLAVETDLREAENDALIAKYEERGNADQAAVYQQFYDQDRELYQRRVITRQEFEEMGAKLIKTQSAAEQSKAAMEAYQAEANLDRLLLRSLTGATISLADLAHGYSNLWKSRLASYQSAENSAKAQYDYWLHVWQNNRSLLASRAASEREVLESQRQARHAETEWHLAHEMVLQNQGFYQASLDTESQLQQQ